MTMSEAAELAEEIANARPDWLIIAIGRFCQLDTMQPTDPFGVSVRLPGSARPRVLWGIKDYHEAAEASPLPETVPAATADGYLF